VTLHEDELQCPVQVLDGVAEFVEFFEELVAVTCGVLQVLKNAL